MKTAIFVISHGRATYDRLRTLNAFDRCGYTGEYWIVIDDEDQQADLYKQKYGEKVIQFSKKKYEHVDTCDLIPLHTGTLYVRNALHDIATEMGYDYYAVFDDDYVSFRAIFPHDSYLRHAPMKCFDRFVQAMYDFMDESKLDCVAFAQIGDFVGGLNSGNINNKEVRRKVMNTFFCSTKRPLNWKGRTNEDVSEYVVGGMQGRIMMTNYMIAVVPSQTQDLKGGLSQFYRSYGTYMKSMYTVIQAPGAVKISVMGDKHPRIHHRAEGVNYTPCILREECRKV